MYRLRQTLITLLTVLALLAVPLHTVGAAGMSDHGPAVGASEASQHAHHGDTSPCATLADVEPCLDCATCVPPLTGPQSLGQTSNHAQPAALAFRSKAHHPLRELRPPRTHLV